MRNGRGFIAAVGVAAIVATAGMPDLGRAADNRTFSSGRYSFSFGGSPAAFLASVEGEQITADVVNEQPANAPIGTAFCHVGITFYNRSGFVLYASELKVGPGEIGSVDLPAQQFPKGGMFYITWQVLDVDKNGTIRPCIAIPSARVWDTTSGKTEYYIPIVTN